MLAHDPFRNYVSLDRLMIYLKLNIDIYKYRQHLIDLGLVQKEDLYTVTSSGRATVHNENIHDVISNLSQQIYLEKNKTKEIIEKYNVV